MATLPPETILPRDFADRIGVESDDARAVAEFNAVLAEEWTALHAQAARLALLARISPETVRAQDGFVALLPLARSWQRTLVSQGIDDIAAMLASGLAALATLSSRAQDTAAPALALWREFHAARAALLDVLTAESVS
ncbi:MAG: hypothetical protein ACK4NZ_15805 [Tsuneonella sp.]